MEQLRGMAFAYTNLEVDEVKRIYESVFMLGWSGIGVRTGLERSEKRILKTVPWF